LLDYNRQVIADYTRAKTSMSKMTANMSHDMKTPLTVILGYVEKLKLDQDMSEEERQEMVVRLHQKAEGMDALLNQFFELVRLEAEDYNIELHKVCISEICRQHVLEYYELFQRKELQVDIQIPDTNYY